VNLLSRTLIFDAVLGMNKAYYLYRPA